MTANAPIVKHGMTDERILQKIAEALLAAGLGRMMGSGHGQCDPADR